MMSQWAKNNNEDQMSSLLKKKIFKDVCIFNSSEEIWTPAKSQNFPRWQPLAPEAKTTLWPHHSGGTKRVSPDFQNLRLLLESGASN